MSSRSERFDRGDFSSRYRREQDVAADTDASPLPVVWPVKQPRIGQTVMSDRNGKGRPHKGVDLFVKAGSPVVAAVSGKVVRVVDGRESADEGKRRAGLWIFQVDHAHCAKRWGSVSFPREIRRDKHFDAHKCG